MTTKACSNGDGMKNSQVASPELAGKPHSTAGLKVEPFLHVRNGDIYNPLTGRSIPAKEKCYRELRALFESSISIDRLPQILKDFFIEEKWLVADEVELSHRFLLRYVSLEAHTVCNQACYFCPVAYEPRKDYFMPMEFYEQIVSQLAEYKSTINAVFMINYNEPTIDKRFVDQVRIIKAYDLPPAVNTNGTGLTPKRVDALMAMGGIKFLSVNLSTMDRERYIDDRRKDHLDIVMRNLNYIKGQPLAEQMDLVVLGCGDREHERDFQEISKHFADSYFQVKSFRVMDRAGYLPIGLKPTQPHSRLCGCEQTGSRPLQHLHITPKGKCVLCCEDYREEYVVGDLTRQTVTDVLTGPEMALMRRWVYGLEEAPADFICRKCIYALRR